MFKKLDLPPMDLTLADLELVLDSEESPRFIEYSIQNIDQVLEQTNKKFKLMIPPNVINVTMITQPGSGPHKDAFPVALNYYLDANTGDTTYYWQLKNPELDKTNKDTFTSFDNVDLVSTGSYAAKEKEFFLLNTQQIHSLSMATHASPRYIMRFIWWHSTFDQILDSIVPTSL